VVDQLNAMTGGQAPLVIALFAALALIAVARFVRWLEPRLAAMGMGRRIAKYLRTALGSAAITGAVVVVVWWLALTNGNTDLATALSDFGLRLGFAPDEGAAVTAAMVAASAIVSALVGWVRGMAGGVATPEALALLPVTPAETATFALVLAPIASAGEEIVYRGFLMGQFWAFTGDGWIAAALSSVVFGLMHAYQGTWGILRTGLIGMVFAAGVILTGSLVPSILAHFLANLAGTILRPGTAKAAPG
jgi:membrane protease YdiL (CAAX protease family)